MTDKIPLQQYADEAVAPEYRQTLKTVEDACAVVGWPFVDSPWCCGKPVIVSSLIGAYMAECRVCGRFIRDVAGPQFNENGSAVWFLDHDKIDTETEIRWIAGQRPATQPESTDHEAG